MTPASIPSVLACFLALSLTSTLFAQSSPAPPPAEPAPRTASSGTQVALIDVNYIFKHHASHAQKREKIKERSQALVAAANAQRKELQTESTKLRELTPGSLEFKQLEAQLTQRASDYQVQNEIERRNIMEDEVKLYYATYLEVQRAVDRFSQQYDIQLVLRFDREKADANDPDSIRRAVLNNVVYQKRLDITDLILEAVSPPVARKAATVER